MDFDKRKIGSEEEAVFFARTDFRGSDKLFGLKRSDRRQHMYVIGKTGTGKSALLHNLIVQDISNGSGVCVVDPHGELVESILAKIPKSREKDIIYFNPADSDYHVGFNPLELPDPKYKHLVASGLMGIFTKIWANTWSARMEYILNNAILALLDTPHTTLLGIPRLLTDKEYRQKIIGNLKDPVVKAFWVSEYEQWQDKFRNEAIAPIQNKVGQFLSTSLIRNVVGQSHSTIDVFNLMNEGKIFLVNVSKGRIGEDNSALLGAMLITKIQLSAMERVRIPEEERRDFYLYVDEFQNFATDSFASVLSEARKYRLNLIVAHQYVGQLTTDVSTVVRDAVFGNVGTMLMFRVGAADAEFLESEFTPEFTIEDMVNLPNYRIYLKLMVNGVASRPFSAKTLPPFKLNEEAMTVEEVVEGSRTNYGRRREDVENEILAWSTNAPPEEVVRATRTGEKFTSTTVGNKERFEVNCSMCGTETTVPFEPRKGKPVYCVDCYKKIERGEIKPLFSPKTSENKVAESSRVLSAMGIEFDAGSVGGGGGGPKHKQREDRLRSGDRPPERDRNRQRGGGDNSRRPGGGGNRNQGQNQKRQQPQTV
ncbi:type IV secretion system DNA-binding domain-containing protein, partial [Candidatus Kaiserbacteria bacterium]|nr:type IV secretion system DNA-binding domain-containing protein [Candidatus Kaiserbacteria bacterium]